MANRILTDDGWEDRIRSKLGVSEPYLPDADIQQPDCITVAETNIIKRVPDYASLEGDDRIYLEAAVVCECSSLLCSSMPARLPVSQQGPSETHQLDVDWDKRKTDLEDERDVSIGNISTIVTPSLTCFGVSNPRRW